MIALLVMIGNEALNFAQTTDFEALQQNFANLKQVNLFGYSFEMDLIKDRMVMLIENIGAYLSSKSLAILSSIWESIFMFFVFTLLYVVARFVLEVLYIVLDPRIRYTAR